MESAEEIIRRFDLQPHPEGGFFRETFRDPATVDGRAVSTAIYFLLREGEISRWHKVDATEIWHHYCGAPLELGLADGEGPARICLLGTNFETGEQPQHVIPKGWWQQARSLGAWTLVGCTVAPGFEFSGFEMAPSDWQPGEDG